MMGCKNENLKDYFAKEKRVLIIGGTGSLGRAMIDSMSGYNNITILSRSEKLQQDLKKEKSELSYIIGDVRDRDLMFSVINNYDEVYNFAALKHIDVCELNPYESIKTNVNGAINVADACHRNNIKKMIFSTTDKAVDPISVYGYSKALAEKYILNLSKKSDTTFYIFRWGNVLNSNGSAIPFFIKKLYNKEQVPLTDENMTRFFITMKEATSFMKSIVNEYIKSGVYTIEDSRAASMVLVIRALCDIMNLNYKECYYISGLRECEKIHESLTSITSKKHISSENNHYTYDQLLKILKPMVKMYAN